MNKRNQQLVVAIGIFAVALILSYFSTQKVETKKDADVILVLDISGTMSHQGQYGTKLDDAKKSATEFLNKVDPNLHIGLVTFETDVNLNAPLGSDKTYLKDQINRTSNGDMTSMGDAMALAVDHLMSKGRYNVNKYMVLMTDGLSNYGKYAPEEATPLAVSNNITIYTVAFGSDADTVSLKTIASQTNGQYFYAASGSELVNAFQLIAENISRNPGYYYGSRGLMVVAIFLIVFLPAIVKTGKVAVDAVKAKFMKV